MYEFICTECKKKNRMMGGYKMVVDEKGNSTFTCPSCVRIMDLRKEFNEREKSLKSFYEEKYNEAEISSPFSEDKIMKEVQKETSFLDSDSEPFDLIDYSKFITPMTEEDEREIEQRRIMKDWEMEMQGMEVPGICYGTEPVYRSTNKKSTYLLDDEEGKGVKPAVSAEEIKAINEHFLSNIKVLRPSEIKKKLDEIVIGQDDAKEVLAVACYNHYKRTLMKNDMIERSNVLFVGPTGSGKTHLIRALGKVMNVPISVSVSTNLTESGYVGEDVDSILAKLLNACEGDVQKAEHGIVYIDEIDKLCSTKESSGRDVGKAGVQQALLTMIEGATVDVAMSRGSNGLVQKKVTMNTHNILFICGGAFPKMENIIRERLNKKNVTTNKVIGFQAEPVKNGEIKEKTVYGNVLKHTTVEDLKAFGMIPEFIGRLPVIAVLDELTVNDLKRILTEPKGNIVSQYQELFKADGIRIVFEDEALDYIANEAKVLGTGARSLRTIVEKYLKRAMFDLPDYDNVREFIVDVEFLKSGRYLLKDEKGRLVNVE